MKLFTALLMSIILFCTTASVFGQDSLNINIISRLDTPGWARSIAVSNGHAFVADSANGVRIINVEDRTNPWHVGVFDPLSEAFEVNVSEDILYVTTRSGVHILSLDNPATPEEISVYENGQFGTIQVQDGIAYLSYGRNLRIVDVTDPENPTFISDCGVVASPLGIDISEEYAYLACNNDGGLRIIDISDLFNPVAMGFYDTIGWANDVAVDGDIACVADGPRGLHLIDISNPDSPQLISSVDLPGYSRRVQIIQNHAIVAASGGGLRIVDFSDPEDPMITGFYRTPGGAESIYAKSIRLCS
ncbi:hypothetical protein K8I28_11855 [bacterium]|nr:hypothetical protein [bacterium]